MSLHLCIPKERKAFESRVAITPSIAKQLIDKGFKVSIETNAGSSSYFDDDAYSVVGAQILSTPQAVYEQGDIVLKVNPPSVEEIQWMKKEAVLISFLYAATNAELVTACEQAGISAFAMDAIPRISRAQKMDALSSQANLAGYKSVLLCANALGKIFPMMTTAAGTIRPAKVLIFGAGVAGLQAIATAKRLGAVVEVSDIRPETKEQVASLGAKFIEVPADETTKVAGGYVTEVSQEFLAKQQALIAKHIKEADVVITTALIPGRKAPVLVTDAMLATMKFGSVVLDMAVEQGGNVEGSECNKTIVKNGVTIIGESNLPSLLPMNASELYAKNMQTFLEHLATSEAMHWDMEEEITKGSLILHNGKKIHSSILK
ncbi:MAG: Re/Si-specific NAD(P)(+) transhydrogenase subunit alpha [Bacteroidota bacterium]